MKDFPIFTTEYGVASLVLKQIPYNASAYITLQDSLQPECLLRECCDFCKTVGAEHIYASGHSCLENYQLHTKILLMRCLREQLADTEAILIPIQKRNLEQFRKIYNDVMKPIANASHMSRIDAEQIFVKENGYFVYRKNELIGIGVAEGNRINAIVSVVPGCGKDIILALNRVLSGLYVEIEVASSNTRAVRLYDKLGFQTVCELSKWYKIFDCVK